MDAQDDPQKPLCAGPSFAVVTRVPEGAGAAGYFLSWKVYSKVCMNTTICGGWDGEVASSDSITSVRARHKAQKERCTVTSLRLTFAANLTNVPVTQRAPKGTFPYASTADGDAIYIEKWCIPDGANEAHGTAAPLIISRLVLHVACFCVN